MAHFAEIDSDDKVLRVIVIGNNDCLDGEGNESEAKGIEYCKSLFGQSTNWVQTSYNGNIRGYFAAIGATYDRTADAFIKDKPNPSWVLNSSTKRWEAPTAKPDDGKLYRWFEDEIAWVEKYPNDGKSYVRDSDNKRWVEDTD